MNLSFIHKSDSNRRLILIAAGWGSDISLYSDISISGWDVAVASDFDSDYMPEDELRHYPTIYLYAWSLGVAAASRLIPADIVTEAFAINGTEYPADDTFGIPTAVYDGTESNLDIRNLRKFRRRMVRSSMEFESLEKRLPSDPDIENLRSQLRYFRAIRHSDKYPICWRRAYISESDRIIPASNQSAFWSRHPSKPEIIRLDAPHYVDIRNIVESTIADTEKIGQRFHESLESYDANATAQEIIAARLSEIIHSKFGLKGKEILEIGPGSGLFTRKYAPVLAPGKATFIDLFLTSPFNIAPEETYLVGDAEKLICEISGCFDLILSASTMQWFSDIATFIRNASRKLKPGGMMICSTFLPGTLSQLDNVRPDPMLYPSEEFIRQTLESCFKSISMESDEITLRFDSPRKALMHLKHTGAGGSFPKYTAVSRILEALKDKNGTHLTYKPLYIMASDPK